MEFAAADHAAVDAVALVPDDANELNDDERYDVLVAWRQNYPVLMSFLVCPVKQLVDPMVFQTEDSHSEVALCPRSMADYFRCY